MVISVGNHPPKYMSPLANDLPSSIILWHLFHIVYDMCLWTSCNNPFMFLNPSLPNAWLQNVISPLQVHTSCWGSSLWGSLLLSPRAWWEGTWEIPWEDTSALGFHSSHHASPQPAGLEPGACHSLSLSLDLKWIYVALQHCGWGNEAFFRPVFCKASR